MHESTRRNRVRNCLGCNRRAFVVAHVSERQGRVRQRGWHGAPWHACRWAPACRGRGRRHAVLLLQTVGGAMNGESRPGAARPRPLTGCHFRRADSGQAGGIGDTSLGGPHHVFCFVEAGQSVLPGYSRETAQAHKPCSWVRSSLVLTSAAGRKTAPWAVLSKPGQPLLHHHRFWPCSNPGRQAGPIVRALHSRRALPVLQYPTITTLIQTWPSPL